MQFSAFGDFVQRYYSFMGRPFGCARISLHISYWSIDPHLSVSSGTDQWTPIIYVCNCKGFIICLKWSGPRNSGQDHRAQFTRMNALIYKSGFESSAGHFVQLKVTVTYNWSVKAEFPERRRSGFHLTMVYTCPVLGWSWRLMQNEH